MASTLLCRRLVSRRTLYRSLCQSTHMMGSPFPAPDDTSENLSDDDDYKKYGPMIQLGLLGYGPPDTFNLRLEVLQGLDPPYVSEFHLHFDDLMYYDRKPNLAKSFLTQMITRGAIPDLSIFLLVLKCYCCKRKHLTYQHVLDLFFTQMKALGLKAGDSFYETMVSRVGGCFGPYVGFHLLKKLRSSQRIQMPLSCYNVVVRQLCRWKTINDPCTPMVLADLFMDMEQQWVFPEEESCRRLLQLRNCGGEDVLKAVGIGRLMFAKGLKIGAYAKLE